MSLDGFDFQTTITSVVSCISNNGPGFSEIASQGSETINIGPAGNYGGFSILSKSVLIFSMLIGRLEIYPILMLFSPKIWRNR